MRLKYVKEPIDNLFKPSVDVFFESVSRCWPKKSGSLAILLTGMGNDGAKGLKILRDKGWETIVEDENTCIVFGMPRAAIDLGAAVKVLEIDEIGSAILSFFKK